MQNSQQEIDNAVVAVPSPVPAEEWKSTAKDLLAGTAAGLIAKVIEYPFDTIKVRQQLHPSHSVVQIARLAVQQDGIVNGFYRGLMAPMFGAMAESAIVFALYAKTKRLLANEEALRNGDAQPLFHTTIGGIVSGVGVAFWLTPVEYIKVRLQAPHLRSQYTGVMDCLAQSLRSGGVQTLFQGHSSTLLRETLGGALYFTMYEVACSLMTPTGKTRDDLNPLAVMFAGALSGATYWSSTFPADTIKSRIQSGLLCPKEGFVRNLMHVMRTEGILALYNGLSVTLVRSVPSNGVIFFTYEMIMRSLKDL